MSVADFWDIEPCRLYVNLLRAILVRLIFDPEDGADTFLRNVGSHTDYTALYPRR
jgi:hypothetical protein